MPDFLFLVTVTNADGSEHSMSIDVTSVESKSEAIFAAEALIKGYRHKYVQDGNVEQQLTTVDLTR